MEPPNLLADRWHRLFAGLACGVLVATSAVMLAANVRLGGTRAAQDWFLLATFGFGFALGFAIGAAAQRTLGARRSSVDLPRARVIRG